MPILDLSRCNKKIRQCGYSARASSVGGMMRPSALGGGEIDGNPKGEPQLHLSS